MALVLYGRVLTDGQELPPRRVVVEDGRVTAVEPADDTSGADLDAGEGWIAPGLIDLQLNGAGGVDLTSAANPPAALEAVARTLVQYGVTSFCPTVVSSPERAIVERLAAYGPRATPRGAGSLGAHVEGPFINPAHRGVHDPDNVRPVDLAELERWLAHGTPALVTLAPELPEALDAIRLLAAHEVLVSLGHSGATMDEAWAGLWAGARMATHLFNAMPPLHHREPELVGALLDPRCTATVGLIADGVHVAPSMLALAVRLAGGERVTLVSDALAAAGAPPGPSLLGDQTVISDGRSVRRADGTLAGSALLLDGCLRNARRWLSWLSPAEVIRMATQTPAEALGSGAARRKGRVAPGYDADLVLVDRGFNIVTTLVGGEVVYDPHGLRRTSPFVGAALAPPMPLPGPRSRAQQAAALQASSPASDQIAPASSLIPGQETLTPPSTSLDLLPTEQPNPRTADLDALDTLSMLHCLNDEDQEVAPAVREALPAIAQAVDLAHDHWRRGGRVVLFGAGTSGRLAFLDAAELGPTFGVRPDRYLARIAGGPGAMQVAVEGAEDDIAAGRAAAADVGANDVAFGIAASGRTPWVQGALEAARARGAATVVLACVPAPALAARADVTIVVDTGPEAVSGSTRMKAGTAQKLVLNSFSTALMVRLGKVYGNLMVDVQATNAKLRRRAVRLTSLAAGVDEVTAASVLNAAGGSVKLAVLMLRLSLDVTTARARLDAAEGHLRDALNAPL